MTGKVLAWSSIINAVAGPGNGKRRLVRHVIDNKLAHSFPILNEEIVIILAITCLLLCLLKIFFLHCSHWFGEYGLFCYRTSLWICEYRFM